MVSIVRPLCHSLTCEDTRLEDLSPGRFHTSTSMRAADIHAKGLDEVTRIENEMAEVSSQPLLHNPYYYY